MPKGNRGIHTRPNEGQSVEWMSPPEIVGKLGMFDLDPCGHPDSVFRFADKVIFPPCDGLRQEWIGRVWLNPPYGGGLKNWLKKLAEHGEGTALVPARTEVESWFWPYVWERASAVLFVRGRLYFRKPDGTRLGNAGHGSVLVAYGDKDAGKLLASGVAGKFIFLK